MNGELEADIATPVEVAAYVPSERKIVLLLIFLTSKYLRLVLVAAMTVVEAVVQRTPVLLGTPV